MTDGTCLPRKANTLPTDPVMDGVLSVYENGIASYFTDRHTFVVTSYHGEAS